MSGKDINVKIRVLTQASIDSFHYLPWRCVATKYAGQTLMDEQERINKTQSCFWQRE